MKNTLSNDISLTVLCKEHLQELSHSLRQQDRAELWAAYRLDILQGLELCRARSALAVAFLYKGRVAAVAGVEAASLLGRRGCVWSWTGKTVEECPKSFLRVSLRVLELFKRHYDVLFAACDERYQKAQNYLKHLGAQETGEKLYLAGAETRFVLYRF